jgi:hypothetical protein
MRLLDAFKSAQAHKRSISEARLPTFIIVGAAKCATSWIIENLYEHPDVFANRREIGYFDANYDKGLEWYASHFSEATHESAVGEKCPGYFVKPSVPGRIYEFSPDIDLLFVFRDPVQRAYSHYCMHLRSGRVTPNISDELKKESRLVTDGLYMSHLNRFRKWFPDDQLHCLLFDDLKDDSSAFLSSIFDIIGVDTSFHPSLVEEKYHAKRPRPRSQKLLNTLTHIAGKAAEYSYTTQQIIRRIRRSPLVDWFHRLNRGPAYPELPGETKKHLAEYYEDEVKRLSAYLEKPLTERWITPYLDGA